MPVDPALFGDSGWFAACPESLREALVARGQWRKYAPGERATEGRRGRAYPGRMPPAATARPVLLIVIASTRPSRVGGKVAAWVTDRARAHGAFEVRVADLADVGLPLLDEPYHPRLRRYQHEHTKAWSATRLQTRPRWITQGNVVKSFFEIT